MHLYYLPTYQNSLSRWVGRGRGLFSKTDDKEEWNKHQYSIRISLQHDCGFFRSNFVSVWICGHYC